MSLYGRGDEGGRGRHGRFARAGSHAPARARTVSTLATVTTSALVDLSRGDGVCFAVLGRDRIEATVWRLEGIVLEGLCDRPLADGQLGRGVRGTLEYPAIDGMWRVAGELQAVDAPRGHENEYCLRFTAGSAPQLLGRREFLRTVMSADVELVFPDGRAAQGQTVNVGGGGLLIHGIHELELEQILAFVLKFQDTVSIRGTCRVVRVEATGNVAVEFVSIANEHQKRLIQLVFEHEQMIRPTEGAG